MAYQANVCNLPRDRQDFDARQCAHGSRADLLDIAPVLGRIAVMPQESVRSVQIFPKEIELLEDQSDPLNVGIMGTKFVQQAAREIPAIELVPIDLLALASVFVMLIRNMVAR